MNFARKSHCVAYIKTKKCLIVAGSYHINCKTAEIFDLEWNAWKKLPEMKKPRSYSTIFCHNDRYFEKLFQKLL